MTVIPFTPLKPGMRRVALYDYELELLERALINVAHIRRGQPEGYDPKARMLEWRALRGKGGEKPR